jgi:Chemotaxis protein histidine kinase and related kinases
MRRDPTSLDMLRQRYAVAMQGLKQLDQPVVAQVVEPSSVGHPVESLLTQDVRDQQDVEPAKVGEGKTAEGKTVEDREVIRVSRDRLERLLNLVGELVIGRGRLEQRLHMLEQLSQQVLACKGDSSSQSIRSRRNIPLRFRVLRLVKQVPGSRIYEYH